MEKKKEEDEQAKERIKVRREKLHALRYHSFSDLFFFGLFLIFFYIPYKDILQKNDDAEICLLLGLFFPIFMFFGANVLVMIVDINKSDCDYIKYGPIQAESRSFWRRCVDVLETKKDGDVNPSE